MIGTLTQNDCFSQRPANHDMFEISSIVKYAGIQFI